MKKSAIFLVLLLMLFATSITSAADNLTTSNVTTVVLPGEESAPVKTDDAFECLELKAGDCSSLKTQEVALTVLATPDNIFDDCIDELKSREHSDHWDTIMDTSLAIIALKHAGQDTKASEEWLVRQNQTPTDLAWYLQQDSNEASECHIGYNAQDYIININENKKIDQDAGPCLSKAQASFWLQIDKECYDEKFQMECDQDFIASLIYKNKDSSTIYVLEGTASAPAFGSVDLQVKSKCFGDNSCDYESTAWATLALLETGHNVEEFIPYIIAMSETNERQLPGAFIYILTNYEDYASSLIADQKLGNYWEAKSTAHNRYYDTSLALLALSSSNAEQIIKAKEWLWFSQGSNGCWQNSVRETAMALWALEGRTGRSSSSTSSVVYCSEANYFCIPSSECSDTEDVGDNYFCPSLSDTCCMSQNLKTCSEYNGQECPYDQICTGNSRVATDTDECCTGSCEERVQENECEANFYTCMDSCSDFQEPISTYSCDQTQVCCKTKTDSTESSSWWVGVLVSLIIITLIAIGYIYREQLKLYWFQLKTKFKKDDEKGSGKPSGPGSPSIPSRPGFPPIRRPYSTMSPGQRPVAQARSPSRGRSYDRRDKAMSDTFEKLRDMSK